MLNQICAMSVLWAVHRLGQEVWEGLAGRLTHLSLASCPDTSTCGLFPALAGAGRLAALDVEVSALVPGLSGQEVASCCAAAAGVSSLWEVSLQLSELIGTGLHGGAHDLLFPCRDLVPACAQSWKQDWIQENRSQQRQPELCRGIPCAMQGPGK